MYVMELPKKIVVWFSGQYPELYHKSVCLLRTERW